MNKAEPQRIDWSELKRHMEEVRAVLDETSLDRQQETLRRRAGLLARPLSEAQAETGAGFEGFQFRVGETRLLLPADEVLHTFRLRESYRMPGMPEVMPGVLPFRGDLIAAVDLRRLLHIHSGDPAVVVVAAGDGNTVGLLADEMEQERQLPQQSFYPVPSHFSKDCQRFVQAVTSDLAMLLDLSGICQFLRALPLD